MSSFKQQAKKKTINGLYKKDTIALLLRAGNTPTNKLVFWRGSIHKSTER